MAPHYYSPKCVLCHGDQARTTCQCESVLLKTKLQDAEKEMMENSYKAMRNWVQQSTHTAMIRIYEKNKRQHEVRYRRDLEDLYHKYRQQNMETPPSDELRRLREWLHGWLDWEWQRAVNRYADIARRRFQKVRIDWPGAEDEEQFDDDNYKSSDEHKNPSNDTHRQLIVVRENNNTVRFTSTPEKQRHHSRGPSQNNNSNNNITTITTTTTADNKHGKYVVRSASVSNATAATATAIATATATAAAAAAAAPAPIPLRSKGSNMQCAPAASGSANPAQLIPIRMAAPSPHMTASTPMPMMHVTPAPGPQPMLHPMMHTVPARAPLQPMVYSPGAMLALPPPPPSPEYLPVAGGIWAPKRPVSFHGPFR